MSIEEAVAQAIKEAVREPIATHVDDLCKYRSDGIIKNAIKEAILENIEKWHTAPEDAVREGIKEAFKDFKG